MRQIKFRGKRNDQDEWVFGDLIEENGGDTYIVQANIIQWKQFEVDPDTVSQFTGLVDRNGKEVYHKDIVNHENYGEGVIEWDDKLATFFVDFGSEDLELMVILSECELLKTDYDTSK